MSCKVGVDLENWGSGECGCPMVRCSVSQEMVAAWVSKRKYLVNVEISVCQP